MYCRFCYDIKVQVHLSRLTYSLLSKEGQLCKLTHPGCKLEGVALKCQEWRFTMYLLISTTIKYKSFLPGPKHQLDQY